jgi:hypothetical protein
MTLVEPPKPLLGDFYYIKERNSLCRMVKYSYVYVPHMTYYGMIVEHNVLCSVYCFRDCEYKLLYLEELLHYSKLSTLQKHLFNIPLNLGDTHDS